MATETKIDEKQYRKSSRTGKGCSAHPCALCHSILFMAWLVTLPVVGFILRIIISPFMALGKRNLKYSNEIHNGDSRLLDCSNYFDISSFLFSNGKFDCENKKGQLIWNHYRDEIRNTAKRIFNYKGANMPKAVIEPKSAINIAFKITEEYLAQLFMMAANNPVGYYVFDREQLDAARIGLGIRCYFSAADIAYNNQPWIFSHPGEYYLIIENYNDVQVDVEYHIFGVAKGE